MKLYAQRLGKGFPVIILHGLYGSGDNWLTIARSLSDRVEVFLVDQRNHGRSPHSGQHNYQVLADDLVELMDDNHLKQAVILGHSMGGKAAMWFAAQHPDRVTRLIIADIGPGTYPDNPSETSHSSFHRSVLESMLAIDFASASGLGDIDRQLGERLPGKRLRQFLLKNIEKNEDAGFNWRLNVPALLNNIDNLSAGLESFLEAGRVINEVPVLFIRGENSDFIREPDREMIHRLFPESRLVTIKNAGHWLHAEQPDVFISIVKGFLKGIYS
ncbi:MAG: alpha/beta fold hydrolase [Bacteroidales bacterium]|nr:alpha/beta fold hydrolase [Bacteroidales bacterium]